IDNEWMLGLAGLASIVFGVLAVISPGDGAVALVWTIGVYAIVVGTSLIALGFRLHGWGRRLTSATAYVASSRPAPAPRRSPAARPPAVRHRSRRAGHPLPPRSLEARERFADDRHPRLARLGRRAAEDRRAADRPHGARRERIGRVRPGDPVAAGSRLFRQTE